MSDVLSDAQMYLSEPDETVLTAALRNKDDIPILMDVVGADEVTTPVSQEMHLKNLLSVEKSPTPSESKKTLSDSVVPESTPSATARVAPHFKYEPPETKKTEFKYEPPEETVTAVVEAVSASVSKTAEKTVKPVPQASKTEQSQLIATAIRNVLERRLPGLVAEVMTEISKRKGQ
ncbi:hypothetical protein [Marinomonas fungiae]|uniref:Uncharacterized protein n=1 Tax=Marinomonas fungiae TaxID=1137284 RepID=A0A0K6ISJ3_9GAMM|nr:hypothetical protein [Marinomonas fungiae]CUB06297.1 hypothetical protein Ga0061065_11674 [Marinomonas fungiae]